MIGLSAAHVLVFAIIAIILFGDRLPSVARSFGRSLVELKKGIDHLENQFPSSPHSTLPYEQRFDRKRVQAISEGYEHKLSPLYWPAIRFGVFVQAILGILTVLMLDMGQSLGVFKVAFLGHWFGIFLLLARRPTSPAKTDIIF